MTGIELWEEPQQVAAPDAAAKNRFSVLVETVRLKHVLRDIKPDNGHLHGVAPVLPNA